MLKKVIGLCLLSIMTLTTSAEIRETNDKTRVIVTSDGEIDDECSLVRFLLYTNEWDVEGIITSSSQYHWQGYKWAGDDWAFPYLDAYEKVYPNLIRHDKDYPSPDYLRERTLLGNVKAEGEMDEVTPGSELIVKVLLDETDSRPVWLQAWGGTNTIARALKTIEEKYPEKMKYVERYHRNPSMWEYTRKTRIPVEDLYSLLEQENRGLDKVQALFADMDERRRAWEELSMEEDLELVGSLGYNIEINARGVNKGTALVELGRMLGIKREEIMACGDGDNDTAMLREVGFGVAMGNAEEEIKQAADYVTLTNEDEGVAYAIEKFILGGGEGVC